MTRGNVQWVDSASHHAAMCALWLYTESDVSIVQLIKSLNALKELIEVVEEQLASSSTE